MVGSVGRGLGSRLNGVVMFGWVGADPPLSLRDIPCLRWGKLPRGAGGEGMRAP